MTRAETTVGVLVVMVCAVGSFQGQTPVTAKSGLAQAAAVPATTATATMNATGAASPLAFEVVSVKPAAPGTFPIVPPFMRSKGASIVGQQTMAAPVWMTIAYAYHLQMSEALATVRKQPDWVRDRIYTETFRAEGEPTRDQVREMVRTMLADRFGLQTHEFMREGAVNKLVMSKPGVLGPNLKPHVAGSSCTTQEGASVGKAPDAAGPPVVHCGFSFYNLPGNVLHVGITDTTIADAVRSLAGMGVGGGSSDLETRPIVDATGMTGKYDVTVEFRPDSGSSLMDAETDDGGVPTLIQAMKEQLGLRVESGTGPVRMVVIDHISEPTPD